MENPNEKPLCLRIEDAENEIAEVINRHRTVLGLPYFILEPIIRKFYSQIVDEKAVELNLMRRDYEATKKKKKEKKGG